MLLSDCALTLVLFHSSPRKKSGVFLILEVKEKEDKFHLTYPSHMSEGEEFQLRVTVLQALNVSSLYADVFCQFKYVLCASKCLLLASIIMDFI